MCLARISITFHEHIGTPISFTAQYLSIGGNHSMANCDVFAIDNPNQPQGPGSAQPNVVTGRGPGRAILPAAVSPAPCAGV